LAVRRRPMLESLESLERVYDSRDVEAELYADVFAVAVEEPRAARRIAPNAVRAVENQMIGKLGRF